MTRPHEQLEDAAARLRTAGCYNQAARLQRAAFHARRSSLAASPEIVTKGELAAAGAARIAARLLLPLGQTSPATGLLAMAEQLMGGPAVLPALAAAPVQAAALRLTSATPATRPAAAGTGPAPRRTAATAT